MSSFSHYARKACNPELDIWIRWSALHSCLLRYFELTHQRFSVVRDRLIKPLQVGQNKPPTEQQMWSVVSTLEAERNKFLERLHAFDRKRLREKAQGRTTPSKKDFEALYLLIIE